MPQGILRNTVILWLNTPRLETALAAARDMRACTKTVLITPNFFLAHGPAGVRCFYELGVPDVVLDMRLLGSPSEIWQCVHEAARQGIKAVTISAMAGARNLKHARDAAESSKQFTYKIVRPLILVSLLPAAIDDAEMVDQLQMRVRRRGHVAQAAYNVTEMGADGMIVEYEDMKYIPRAIKPNIPLLVYTQRRVRNYTEVETADDLSKAGISELLAAGASHIIYDSQLTRHTDAEWAADMIRKEIESARR